MPRTSVIAVAAAFSECEGHRQNKTVGMKPDFKASECFIVDNSFLWHDELWSIQYRDKA